MPLHIVPRRIAAHRIACKALYRALLIQCPRIPIPHDIPRRGPVNLIKHLIRKHFKANINVTSERLCVKGLEKGYVTENLLRSAGDGNEVALTQIHNFLRTLNAEVELARQRCTQPTRPSLPLDPEKKPRVSPYPGAPKVLDIRPLPKEKLTGRRRVPILTSTSFIPFLRFKKPQSPYLARVLRDKLMQKQRRVNAIIRIEEEGEIGEAEAEWEREVKGRVESELWNVRGEESEKQRMRRWLKDQGRDFGAVHRNQWKANAHANGSWNEGDTSEWAIETARAKWAIWASVNRDQKKAFAVGAKMLRIVEQEKELWEKERRGRKAEKKGRVGNGGPGGSIGPEESVKWKAEKGATKPEITEEIQKLVTMLVDPHKAEQMDNRQESEMERKRVAMKYQSPVEKEKQLAAMQNQLRQAGLAVRQNAKGWNLVPEGLALQNAQSKLDSAGKSVKQKPEKVDLKTEAEEEMRERKLMAIEHGVPEEDRARRSKKRKAEKVHLKPERKLTAMQNKLHKSNMARKEQKAKMVHIRPETVEDMMMEKKLLAIQTAQRTADMAARNGVATF